MFPNLKLKHDGAWAMVGIEERDKYSLDFGTKPQLQRHNARRVYAEDVDAERARDCRAVDCALVESGLETCVVITVEMG